MLPTEGGCTRQVTIEFISCLHIRPKKFAGITLTAARVWSWDITTRSDKNALSMVPTLGECTRQVTIEFTSCRLLRPAKLATTGITLTAARGRSWNIYTHLDPTAPSMAPTKGGRTRQVTIEFILCLMARPAKLATTGITLTVTRAWS